MFKPRKSSMRGIWIFRDKQSNAKTNTPLFAVKYLRKLIYKSIALLSSLKKRLRGHPNIVQFYSAASLSEKETDHGMSEFLILTELCSGKIF